MGAGGAGGPDWGRVGVRGPRCVLGRDRTLGIEPMGSNPRDRTHGLEPSGSNSFARAWGGFMGRGGCLGQPRALRCSCELCYVMLCYTGRWYLQSVRQTACSEEWNASPSCTQRTFTSPGPWPLNSDRSVQCVRHEHYPLCTFRVTGTCARNPYHTETNSYHTEAHICYTDGKPGCVSP